MLYLNRKKFEKISKGIGKSLGRLPLTPNQWTVSSLVLSLVTLYFLASGSFLIAAIVFAFTSFIDMVDGAVARQKGKVTKAGGYLDSITDRAIEFVI
jgi:archaetidylinositol phosphate synthase